MEEEGEEEVEVEEGPGFWDLEERRKKKALLNYVPKVPISY